MFYLQEPTRIKNKTIVHHNNDDNNNKETDTFVVQAEFLLEAVLQIFVLHGSMF